MSRKSLSSKDTLRRVINVCIVVLLLFSNLTLIAQADGNDGIDEETADIDGEDMKETFESGTIKNRKKDKKQYQDEKQYAVSLEGPVLPEWRDKLEDEGADIVNYIPDYMYRIFLEPEQVEDVEELGFVKDIKEYTPLKKIDDSIGSNKVRILFRNRSFIDFHKKHSDLSPNATYRSSLITQIDSKKDLLRYASDQNVLWIEEYLEPHLHDETATEIVGGNWKKDQPYDGPGNLANKLGFNGSNVVISICDTGIGNGTVGDAGHQDFTGRVIGGREYSNLNDWTDVYGHGTHCAGLAAGDTFNGRKTQYGNTSYYVGQGVTPEANLYSQKIFSGNMLPDFDTVFRDAEQNGTYVHSNSWGYNSYGMYISVDALYDEKVRDANYQKPGDQPMIITVSAGNSGPYETSTGSPGNAKNVITVGASQNYHPDAHKYGNKLLSANESDNVSKVTEFSSRGPTGDNRIKPDVVAPGMGVLSTASPKAQNELYGYYSEDEHYMWCSGTSMSNPIVAGSSAVVVDWYNSTFGERPSPAMVKAILTNTGDDMDNGIPIPNFHEGWGRVNLSRVVKSDTSRFIRDQEKEIQTGEEVAYNIECDDPDEPMKISLVWTDAPSNPYNPKHLVNDLDMKVYGPDGNILYGNAFENGTTVPNSFSRWDVDEDGTDDKNNVVNVFIPPEKLKEGMYSVVIDGKNIPMDGVPETDKIGQDFALFVDNGKKFEDDVPQANIYSPVKDGVYVTNESMDIKWETGGGDGELNLDLEYSLDAGDSWTEIVDGINDDGHYEWTLPYADSKECIVKAEVHDDEKDSSTTSSRQFTIEPILIELLSPTTGINFVGNSTEEIRWNTLGGSKDRTVDIWCSSNNGFDWDILAENMSDDSQFKWTPPNKFSDKSLIKIRVKDSNDDNYTVKTEGTFNVLKSYKTPFFDDVEEYRYVYTDRNISGKRFEDNWDRTERTDNLSNICWRGDYDDGSIGDSALVTPPLKISDDRMRFSFMHNYSFGYNMNEYGDGGIVEIWDNENKEWSKLDPVFDYDGRSSNGSMNPIGGQRAFVGQSERWVEANFDIDNYSGKFVRLRFHLSSDGSSFGRTEGWYIDDISLDKPPKYELKVSSSDKEKRGTSGESLKYKFTIDNTGSEDDEYLLSGESQASVKFVDEYGLDVESVDVKAHSTETITARVKNPSDVEPGKELKTRILVRSKNGSNISKNITVYSNIPYEGSFDDEFSDNITAWESYDNLLFEEANPWRLSEEKDGRSSLYSGEEQGFWYLGFKSMIESPYVKLSEDESSLRLSIDHFYNLSETYLGYMDGGIVEIWDNETEEWSKITPMNGYDGKLVTTSNPLGSKSAFSGYHKDWKRSRFNITEYAGRTVKIRFCLGWDSYRLGGTGWFIDTLHIGSSPDYEVESRLNDHEKLGYIGDKANYTLNVTNYGMESDIVQFRSRGGWDTEFYQGGRKVKDIILPPGSSEEINLHVDVPETTEPGSTMINCVEISSRYNGWEPINYIVKTETAYRDRYRIEDERITPDWTHKDIEGVQFKDRWQLSEKRVKDSEVSWWSGPEIATGVDGEGSVLESPYLKLSDDSKRTELEFDHWYRFGRNPEGYGDGGIIELWDDENKEWNITHPEKSYPVNLSENYYNPLSGKPAFGGSSRRWVHSSFDLSNYTGNIIKVRFHVGWDIGSYQPTEGWFIDNIQIGQPDDYEFELSKEEIEDYVGAGDKFTFNFSITNTGLKRDTYRLESDLDWSTQIHVKDNEIEIESTSTRNIKIDVEVPIKILNKGIEDGSINIRSKNCEDLYKEIELKLRKQTPILLVDDDGGLDIQDKYKEPLNSTGYEYSIWSINDSGVPNFETIKDFDIIIWTTGNSVGSYGTIGRQNRTLIEEERELIAGYLESGGYLYLSSSGAARDAEENGWENWHKKYLNSTMKNYRFGDSLNIDEKYRDPIMHELNFYVYKLNSDKEVTRMWSYLEVKDKNRSAFRTHGSYVNGDVGVKIDTGNYKLVYTSFEFAGIYGKKNKVMSRIIQWFYDYPPYSGVNHPEHLSSEQDYYTWLSVHINEDESRNVNVSFYDAEDDSLIGKKTNVSTGSNVSVFWNRLDPDTGYRWYVEVEDDGKVRRSKEWYFSTKEDNFNPIAKFHLNEDISVGQEKKLDGSLSSDNCRIDEYKWTIEHDGKEIVYFKEDMSYEFSEMGNYTVRLKVIDAAGLSDSKEVKFEVKDIEPPVLDIGEDRTIKVGDELGLGAARSHDGTGIIVYRWNFGDGNRSYGPNVTHIYQEPGTYDVTLTAVDDYGNRNMDKITVDVSSKPDSVGKDKHKDKINVDQEWFFAPIIIGVLVAVLLSRRYRK